jgi:hypothetical protein
MHENPVVFLLPFLLRVLEIVMRSVLAAAFYELMIVVRAIWRLADARLLGHSPASAQTNIMLLYFFIVIIFFHIFFNL